jgi:hypothetical protein
MALAISLMGNVADKYILFGLHSMSLAYFIHSQEAKIPTNGTKAEKHCSGEEK